MSLHHFFFFDIYFEKLKATFLFLSLRFGVFLALASSNDYIATFFRPRRYSMDDIIHLDIGYDLSKIGTLFIYECHKSTRIHRNTP